MNNKIFIPKIWYQDFKQNRLLFTRPSRVQVIKLIKFLQKEVLRTKTNYIEFGILSTDLMYLEKHLVQLQSYLDLLSCC